MKKASMKGGIVILASLTLAVACRADIIIVDDDGPADFNNIQAAINDSNDGDIIYVFPGRYAGEGNRDIDFGGRAIAVQSVAPEDPYIVAATIIDCNGSYSEQHRGFNFQNGEEANSILSGLAVTNGYADNGGAIRCHSSDPTISNCTMIANSAVSWGGGIYCHSSMAQITNCTITDNGAGRDGGGMSGCYRPTGCIISDNSANENGGGLYRCDRPTGCVVTGNSAGEFGGGMHECYWATRCVVSGNSASESGGGLTWSYGPTGCMITCNSAQINGGGIYSQGNDEISDCTIAWNTARAGSGGGIFSYGDNLTNCILWANTDSTGGGPTAQTYGGPWSSVWFCCIQDEDPNDANIPFGGGDNSNIDDYPVFLRDANDGGDGWGVGDTDDFGDLHLSSGSPCINAGDPFRWIAPISVDIDGEPRVMGLIVDMGADEFLMPTIIVTRPQGGEVWTSGSWHQIMWDSAAVTRTVDIAFSSDNGGQWTAVENNVPNTASYTWHLPSVDSNQCLISVVPSIADPNGMYVQSGLFAIGPYSPGPDVPSKWKTLGGDFDRIGRSDYRGPELGCVKWEFEVDGAISASVTVGPNEIVYVPCEDGNLYTLDANGSVLWTYEAESPLISAATLGPDGTAYVGSKDGKLYAIDINGNLRWTHTTEGLVYSSPAVSADGNQVYVCSEDGKLHALGRDGSELWTFETDGFGLVEGAIFASPAVGPNGTVYIGGLYDSNLYALDPNDGNTNWVCHFDSDGWLSASPVIAPDGTIYQTLLYDPNLYAVDPNNGNIIWSTHLAEVEYGEQYSSSYWFEPDYPGSASGFDTRDCQARYSGGGWNVSDSGWSEPVVGRDGRIYVSFDDPWLRVVEPNGVIERILKVGSQSGFCLTAGRDGNIYAASNDSNLYALNPGGFEIARFDSNDYWLNFPVLSADNTLIIGDSRNNSLLISYENNKVRALSSEGCGGQELDLYWQGGPQDLNDDGVVDYLDVAIVAEDWLKCRACRNHPDYRQCRLYYDTTFAPGDVNRDRYVNFADIAVIAERWSAGY